MAGPDKSNTPNKDAQDAEYVASLGSALSTLLEGYSGNTGPTNTSTTSSVSSDTRLTPATARALMTEAAEGADYVGKFSEADVAQFMAKFKEKQDAQRARVITIASSKIVPGSGPDAVRKVMETTAREEFPSFFKPTEFAEDFIWTKINFKDEATLGAKSLDAIARVRGLVDSFQLLGVSDAEAKIAAKEIARGKKTIEDYTVELQQKAKKEYPQFADRFAMDPTLTTYDIASPIINMLSKTWQVDAKTIKMDDPIVTKWLRFAGPDGKGQQPSYNDLLIEARKSPKYELTTEANENARSAATALGSALGYGV